MEPHAHPAIHPPSQPGTQAPTKTHAHTHSQTHTCTYTHKHTRHARTHKHTRHARTHKHTRPCIRGSEGDGVSWRGTRKKKRRYKAGDADRLGGCTTHRMRRDGCPHIRNCEMPHTLAGAVQRAKHGYCAEHSVLQTGPCSSAAQRMSHVRKHDDRHLPACSPTCLPVRLAECQNACVMASQPASLFASVLALQPAWV